MTKRSRKKRGNISNQSGHPNSLHKVVRPLSAEGKNEEAISHYKMAINLKPDYAKAYNNLGEALFTEQKIEEAISYYKMAIKLKPDYANAHSNLKIAISKLGKQ